MFGCWRASATRDEDDDSQAGAKAPSTEAEEEAQLAAALAASLDVAGASGGGASCAEPPRASSASTPPRAPGCRSGDEACDEGCGRLCAVGPDGRHFKTCCKSCPYLRKQEQPAVGHDVECDIRHDGGLCPPWYWRASARWPEAFHEEIGGEYVKKMGAKLLQRRIPNAEVVQADRIEDSALWRRYSERRAALRCCAVQAVDFQPETLHSIAFSARTTLDGSVNEVYLFHGTSAEAARAIAQSNFRPSSAGCFGSGAYFADCADRSDTYSRTNEDGTRIMLLCRVALGNVSVLPTGQHRDAAERLARGGEHHSLLGTTACGKEIVIWDTDQIYPEYIMHYTKSA